MRKRKLEAEAVEAVLFLWKRKRENSTAFASTYEGRMEEERKLFVLSFREEQIGGAYTLRNESEEESFSEMWTPT